MSNRQRHRLGSGTTGRREVARIAMAIHPALFRPWVANRRFRPTTARALAAAVAKGVLNLIGAIRRNASSNWNLTLRSAGACRVATTSRSVAEPPLNDMPIAVGPMARSAFLIWRPEEAVAPEFSVCWNGVGPPRTRVRSGAPSWSFQPQCFSSASTENP